MRLIGFSLMLLAALSYVISAVHAADTASITSKSDDGAYLALDDGTKWIVAPSDRSTVTTWVIGDDVVEVSDSQSCTNTEIINTDENGDEACVRPLSN